MRASIEQLLTCLTAITGVAHSLALRSHVVHEKREFEHDSLFKRFRVGGHIKLPVRIGLTQRNLEFGGNELLDISDPHSARYGQHYTAEQVSELFAPAAEALDSVRQWVEGNIKTARVSVSTNKQWIQFNADVAEMEDLLHTKFYHFHGPTEDLSGIGCDEYHIPRSLRDHIDYISPGVKLLRASRSVSLQKRHHSPSLVEPIRKSDAAKSYPCKELSPHCIKKIYNIHDSPPKSINTSIGIFEQYSFYQEDDLKTFLDNYTNINPDTKPVSDPVDGGVKANFKKKFPGEANGDVQLVSSLADEFADVVVFDVDDAQLKFGNTGFNTFLDGIDGSYCNYTAFGETGDNPIFDPKYPDPSNKTGSYKGQLQCGRYKPTDVISVSYIEAEDFYPQNYQRRQCNEFMKLGLQGISIIFASGDNGVEAHYTPNGIFCLGAVGRKFAPNSPINCPYVTTVGATRLEPNGMEVATTLFPSGGGFSNLYPRPKYQHDAVSKYLSDYTPSYPAYNVTYESTPSEIALLKGRYNMAGRGYPDVSAFGENVLFETYGEQLEFFDGTSASTPIFAAIIARINAARVDAGKKTLGFLNPMLYKHPEMFTDIVSGKNPGCHSQGFNATPGWDPVTGLGSPNYEKMKKILLNLP